MTVEYSARSHVGKVRGNNEDNLYADGVILTADIREHSFAIDGSAYFPAVFAVCDGMGGEEDGEIASQMAAQTILAYAEKIKSNISGPLDETIQSYVNYVNELIISEANIYGKRMGTTLALAVAAEGGVFCFNLGDSRIYCLQRKSFRKVTNDHTLAAGQVRNGTITANQAAYVKDGNKLTRCIGIGDKLIVESYPPILGKCRILICSDGLTDMVREADIENALRGCEGAADAADHLLDAALKNGGKDNVTLIVIDIKNSKIPFLHSIVNKLKG